MSFSDDENRRPPPSTGRQDRHRPEPPDPAPEPRGEPAAPLPPPRGAAHYDKARANQIGLGCLVALFLAGSAGAVILLALGLTSNDDFVPAGSIAPSPTATEDLAGAPAAEPDAAPAEPPAE
jgi:hypothetical protein